MNMYVRVAQWLAHSALTRLVAGSSPVAYFTFDFLISLLSERAEDGDSYYTLTSNVLFCSCCTFFMSFIVNWTLSCLKEAQM